MRIVIAGISRNLIGGVEEYIARVIPLLRKKGHELAYLHETPVLPHLPLIPLPAEVPVWNMATLGRTSALGSARDWKCDIIYCNGVAETSLARAYPSLSRAVFSIHSFWGTCISGTKSFRAPAETPCARVFGPACLAHFYPNRCGGLNPLTMVKDYLAQPPRLAALKAYDAIIVHSDYMRHEYAKHGLPADRVYLPLEPGSAPSARRDWLEPRRRLLFVGRMTKLKGVHLLLDALARVQSTLGVALNLTLAGDGPERPVLERRAAQLFAQNPKVKCDFVGWADPSTRSQLLAESDVLVVPSTWPEPFGMVGPEAAAAGLPAVAFALGGIPEWLRHGVNGLLASGDPPTAEGLAKALIDSLANEELHKKLCAGARATYAELAKADAAAELTTIFERVLSSVVTEATLR